MAGERLCDQHSRDECFIRDDQRHEHQTSVGAQERSSACPAWIDADQFDATQVFELGIDDSQKGIGIRVNQGKTVKQQTQFLTKPIKELDYCFVGSDNRVKLNAVKRATGDHWPQAVVKGFKVNSGVPAQPRTDDETKQGAINRAKLALTTGLAELKKKNKVVCLGFGLEGGVCDLGEELWSTVWGAVVDQDGRVHTANGSRIKLPPIIADPIRSGEEMGPALSHLFAGADIRHNQGMIGVVTRNFVTRTDEYANITKLALGLWYGDGWDE